MKILMVHPHDIFDPLEPWTIRIESLAREFVRKGHDVRLIHFVKETSIERETRHAYGFTVISLKRRGRWRVFTDIFHIVAQEVAWADVVHFQKCFHYVSLPVLFGVCAFRKPVHYDWDDCEAAIYEASAHPPRWIIHFFLKKLEEIIPRMVDTISTASNELKKKCLALKIAEDRIYDAPVGADLRTFGSFKQDEMRKKFCPKGNLVLYVGQLNGAQYTTLFIKAVALLKKELTDTRFIIIGSGTKINELKRYARKKGVMDVLRFVGAIHHSHIPQYLAACDVAVACFEDNEITRCKSPLKVVEYLAAGKVVVASSVGEVKTMLDGCGILVSPGSSASLAEGIRDAIKNPDKRESLEVKARKRAEKIYNWPRVADNLLKAYEHALSLRGCKTISIESQTTKNSGERSEKNIAIL